RDCRGQEVLSSRRDRLGIAVGATVRASGPSARERAPSDVTQGGSRPSAAPTFSFVATPIGRPEDTVADWASGKSLVDPQLLVEIERITGVSRHEDGQT